MVAQQLQQPVAVHFVTSGADPGGGIAAVEMHKARRRTDLRENPLGSARGWVPQEV